MKLSIVIPCYNEAKTIRTLVERVRSSPYPDKEIIIVDDCSRDGTRDVLRTQIEPMVDKIIYHEVEPGKGRGAAHRICGRDRATPSSSRTPTWSTTRTNTPSS